MRTWEVELSIPWLFFDLYKDEIRGDLSRIKYSVHQAFIEGQKGNKKLQENLLTGTEELYSSYKAKTRKIMMKNKDLDKLSLAAADMKMALNENNKELLR